MPFSLLWFPQFLCSPRLQERIIHNSEKRVHLILASAIPDCEFLETQPKVSAESSLGRGDRAEWGKHVDGLLPEQRARLLAVGLPGSASLGKENVLGQDGQPPEFCSLFSF